MFQEGNENDARASLKAYAAVIAHDQKFSVEPNPLIFEGVAEMEALLRAGKLDVVAAPAAELLAVPARLLSGQFLMAINGTVAGEEYVLLSRVDSGVATLADLKGRRVVVLNSVQGSLAHRWLDVQLGTAGLESSRQFCGEVLLVAKPTLAILPVFFNKVDACVITRDSFLLAVEMNPQIGRGLRILATSPVVVPVITAFRREFDPTLRGRIVETMASLRASVAGRQLLTIFQSDHVESRDDAALATTRQLLADHARLTAPTTVPHR